MSGKGGIGHGLKVGASWIHEPRLFITFATAKGVAQYTHLDDTLDGPIATVTLNDGDSPTRTSRWSSTRSTCRTTGS